MTLAPLPPQPPAPYERSSTDCKLEGKSLASREVSTSGDVALGVLWGAALGVLGWALAYLAAEEPDPPIAQIPSDSSEECKRAFIDAYKEQGRKKRAHAGVLGGIAGTAIVAGIALIATSD